MTDHELSIRAWLVAAGEDRRALHILLAAQPPCTTLVCYLAQQQAEKTLKALLVAHQVDPPREHDLVSLLSACLQFQPHLAPLRAACNWLNQFAVAPRYPSDRLFPVGDAQRSEQEVEQVWSAVLALIPPHVHP